MCAVCGNRPDLVSLLLSCGADVAPRGSQVVPRRPTRVSHAALTDALYPAAPTAPLTTPIVHSNVEIAIRINIYAVILEDGLVCAISLALSLCCHVQGYTALHLAVCNVHSNLAVCGVSMPTSAMALKGVPSVKTVAELIRRGADVKAASDEVYPFQGLCCEDTHVSG